MQDEKRLVALSIFGLAGYCDGAGFLLFSGFFVSLMSGNSTVLGLRVAEANWNDVPALLIAPVVFVMGVAIGRTVLLKIQRYSQTVLLGLIGIILLAIAIPASPTITRLPLAGAITAMGMLNALAQVAAEAPRGTMITSSLVAMGEGIADRMCGRSARVRDGAERWLVFVLAAFLGALAVSHLHSGAFAVAALGCALLAARLMRRERIDGTHARPHSQRGQMP
jgi:uncharacterized membrane protein YoaK (UPF0700 family)